MTANKNKSVVDSPIPACIKPIRFGHVFRNPGLARFFEIIAAGGAEAFYQGEVAERIVKFSAERGGKLSIRDFSRHQADWIDPVSANYRGYDVWVYFSWGLRFVPDGLGFCLQNRGVLFSLDPRHLNRLEPHKRPFHTIIPALMTKDGRPVFSFGVMGGDVQPQGHAQVAMNLIDFGMSVQQAGEQPRAVHFESSTPTGSKMVAGGSVGLERQIPDPVRHKLAAMGHKIKNSPGVWGGYQGIWRAEEPLRYLGGSDPRKDGCAIGY